MKEINDNRYYWQWKEGKKIKSKYKAPVDSENYPSFGPVELEDNGLLEIVV